MDFFKPSLEQGLMVLAGTSSWQKVLLFFGVWLVLWLPLALPLSWVLKWRPFQPLTPQKKLIFLASLYGLVPLVLWGATAVEGISAQTYGLKLTLSPGPPPPLVQFLGSMGETIAQGFLLAVLGLIVIFSVESLGGWVKWNREKLKNSREILLPIFAVALLIGGIEEAIFRGFLWSVFKSDRGLFVATLISSLLFALSHLIWEQKDTLPQLPGLFLMGLILVLARWVAPDQTIGLAWGLHSGWIWGLTCLDTAELMTYSTERGQWFTGWQGKPLAGVGGLFCLLFTGLVLGKFAFF